MDVGGQSGGTKTSRVRMSFQPVGNRTFGRSAIDPPSGRIAPLPKTNDFDPPSGDSPA